MYAMMLSTEDTLESPTSTLCFPGTTPTMLPVSNNNNIGVLFNESSSNNNNNMFPLSSTNMDSGFMKENTVLHLQDDDIMAAVEAFRATATVYDSNHNVVPPTLPNGVVLEGLNDDEGLVYESNDNLGAEEENMGMMNGDGSLCNVNLEENNKHYWSNIFNLVNDPLSGSSVF